MDSYFDIDPVEGTISTNELLDRESIARHNISVVATKLSELAIAFHAGAVGGPLPRWRIRCVPTPARPILD